MKRLEVTKSLRVLNTTRYTKDTPDYMRDEDPLLDALAVFRQKTGINEVEVEELEVPRWRIDKFRIRVNGWVGTCPKYGLLTWREVMLLLQEASYFTVAARQSDAEKE